jgi:hypothetical protein
MLDDDVVSSFVERGWSVVDLPEPGCVLETRDWLLQTLRSIGVPDLDRLERYHESVVDDRRHFALLYQLSLRFWAEGLGPRIIVRNLSLLQRLVGFDLNVQTHPYLRAARPGRPGDTTGLHRDTYYGASPYEVSVFVPFMRLTVDSALRVVTGSHREPDAAYPFTQTTSPDVEIGSEKHQLGFPYAPRVLDPALDDRAEAVPLELGQALVFGLALVHGQCGNAGSATRFSTDIRVANALAPVAWSRGVRSDYYRPLSSAPASQHARAYLAANAASNGGATSG